MTTMVGLNIVIAAVLGFMALVCAIASLSLRRNKPLAWLAGALAVGTTQTLFLTFASGTILEFISAMMLAPLGFWFANETIYALTGERRLRPQFLFGYSALCLTAGALFASGAPFFYQVLLVQLACTFAMVDAALRLVARQRWRLLEISLLASVAILALLRAARLPIIIWHLGPQATFPAFNSTATEMALLAAESILTMAIITLVITAIVAETITTFRHQSERDSLTGLLNRRAFDARAGYPAAKRGAVIFCDIDHFKRVNDLFGHKAGDDVICVFADIISRTGHPAARIGGEEFALLLESMSVEDAVDLAEMIRARFHGSDLTGLPQDFKVSASFGVAEVAVGCAPSVACDHADAALYLAKNAGRNRVIRAEIVAPSPDRARSTRKAA